MAKGNVYSVECAACGAAKGEACKTPRGGYRARVHSIRSDAARQTETTPRSLLCPTCAAPPGEKCWAMTRPAPGKKGWEYAPFNRRKNRYCSARWALLNGGTFLDSQESAADSGLFAEDFHESATETGLLAELELPFDWGALADAEGIDWAVAQLSAEQRVAAFHTQMAAAQ